MKKIGILTTFDYWAQTYSLVSIVESQLNMLQSNGYEPVLFVNECFQDNPKLTCEVRKVVPVFTYEDYPDISAVSEDLVHRIKKALVHNLQDIDICFTHDLLLQASFLPHNLALRRIDLPIQWYHWIHSQPDGVKLDSLPTGHKLVFLNYSDRLRVAERFRTWMDEVEVVYNPIESYQPTGDTTLTSVFNDKNVRIAYAFCTTRMGAKGVLKVIKIAGKIKNQGKTVGLCFMNSNANAAKEKASINSMLEESSRVGLTKQDICFTSLLDAKYELGVPRAMAREVFAQSNLFIFPTISECCSLVLFEAMSGQNLIVLNEDIPSMKEFGGFDSALYMKFGSIFQQTSYSSETIYYNDWAKIITRMLNSDMPERAKKRADTMFNEKWIWENQLKRLLL